MFQIGELVSKENLIFVLLGVSIITLILNVYFAINFISINKYFFSKSEQENTLEISSSSDASLQTLFVDVSGAVTKPGVYEVPLTARLADVIKLSGGLTDKASFDWVTKTMNMSVKLKDEQKIYVPFEWESEIKVEDSSVDMNYEDAVEFISKESSASYNDAVGLVNINTASLSELDLLPGIGKTYAQKIIDNRPYKDPSEVVSKTKIPENTISKIEGLIKF